MTQELTIDIKLREFINQTARGSKINSILSISYFKFLNYDGDFIKVENEDFISFVAKNRISDYNQTASPSLRTKMKVGRFIKKFLKKECYNLFNISDKDIEIFVNLYKSYFSSKLEDFLIVEGEDIKKWYLEENYATIGEHRSGSLWQSCMRYHEKNKFMNIYSKNPDQVKMLVHLNSDNKLISRALLWQKAFDRKEDTFKVMDRIYSIYEHSVVSFKNWAIQNGYIYKYEQSSKSERLFVVDSEVIKIDLTVKLDNKKFNYYPYIDTFKYLDMTNGCLSNSESFNWHYMLVQNDGGLERQEPEPEYSDWDEDVQ